MALSALLLLIAHVEQTGSGSPAHDASILLFEFDSVRHVVEFLARWRLFSVFVFFFHLRFWCARPGPAGFGNSECISLENLMCTRSGAVRAAWFVGGVRTTAIRGPG
jgi:hypothetical protein